jgi:GC-rich sequence DNA-binding factor
LKAANVSKSLASPSADIIDDSATYGNEAVPYDDTSLSRYGNTIEDDDFTISGSSSRPLPSENAIAAAKIRRETARRLGIDNQSTDGQTAKEDDFISLQVGMPTSKRESRLVREEDEIGEGEDDFSNFTGAEERIALGKKGRKDMERKRKEEMRALIEGGQEDDQDVLMLGGGGGKKVDQEEDEEEREWEMAQIRRGEQRRGILADDDGEPYRPATSTRNVSLLVLVCD